MKKIKYLTNQIPGAPLGLPYRYATIHQKNQTQYAHLLTQSDYRDRKVSNYNNYA